MPVNMKELPYPVWKAGEDSDPILPLPLREGVGGRGRFHNRGPFPNPLPQWEAERT